MWDADGNAVSELQLNVTSFAFSPDSKTLGCVSGDSIIFWDLETLEEISTLPLGDRSSVISLAYAPDGRTVSVGFQDGTVLFLPLGMEHWRERACHIANRQLRKLERRKYRVLEDKALPKLLFWMDEAKFYGGTCPGAPAAD
jgi:WD40 repeat protein